MLRNYALDPSAPSNTDACPSVTFSTPATDFRGYLILPVVLLVLIPVLVVVLVVLYRRPGASKGGW